MNLKIDSKKENALLQRTDVQASLIFEKATPTRKEVVKEIAKQLKAKPELVIVEEIKTAFGNTTAKVLASIYSNKEVMTKVEVKRMIEKHNFQEEAKAEPAKEEAPKEEVKVEAPKVEAKPEKVPEKPAEEAPKEEVKVEAPKEEAPKVEEKPAEEVKPAEEAPKVEAKPEAAKEDKKEEGE